MKLFYKCLSKEKLSYYKRPRAEAQLWEIPTNQSSHLPQKSNGESNDKGRKGI
jgi:hypothetical protein